MPVENATFISQLVATDPGGGEDYATADDHIRLLKEVLQAQFPNFTADAVAATALDLNRLAGSHAAGLSAAELLYVNGVTSAIQTQLDAKEAATQKRYKTALSDETNSTVLINDDHLVGFTLAAARIYAVEGMIDASTLIPPRLAVNATQTPVQINIGMFPMSGEASFAMLVNGQGANMNGGQTQLSGYIVTHATLAGTMDFQFAQSTSSGTSSYLNRGSWARLTDLGASS